MTQINDFFIIASIIIILIIATIGIKELIETMIYKLVRFTYHERKRKSRE